MLHCKIAQSQNNGFGSGGIGGIEVLFVVAIFFFDLHLEAFSWFILEFCHYSSHPLSLGFPQCAWERDLISWWQWHWSEMIKNGPCKLTQKVIWLPSDAQRRATVG